MFVLSLNQVIIHVCIHFTHDFHFFEKMENYQKCKKMVEKWRLFSFCYPASDRAHREDSNASSLASRGLLHPIFWSFLVLGIRFLIQVMFISSSFRLRFLLIRTPPVPMESFALACKGNKRTVKVKSLSALTIQKVQEIRRRVGKWWRAPAWERSETLN